MIKIIYINILLTIFIIIYYSIAVILWRYLGINAVGALMTLLGLILCPVLITYYERYILKSINKLCLAKWFIITLIISIVFRSYVVIILP